MIARIKVSIARPYQDSQNPPMSVYAASLDSFSLLIQSGVNLAYVREQLGHSSMKLTVDVYGHLVPGAYRAALDRLSAVGSLAK